MADDNRSKELASREPTVEDWRDLGRELNRRGALYVVIGGFALRAADYLPDNAVRELQPGELRQYGVIRVADEILVT